MSDQPRYLPRAPMEGIPVPTLESRPGRRLEVAALRISEHQTTLEVRCYRATVAGRETGEWRPMPNAIRVPLWQVENLAAALLAVAAAVREQKEAGHAG
jgi:hypothetical protein